MSALFLTPRRQAAKTPRGAGNWLLIVLMILGGCGTTEVLQPVLIEKDVWQFARSSITYHDAMKRVDDVSAVRLILERKCEEGYDFWVWEDRETHAVTLERLRVDSVGHIYRLDTAEAQWVREK